MHTLTGIYPIGHIEPVTSMWTALADPHRRTLLRLLLERPHAVGELVEGVGLSQPGTSKHLRVLREAGLVSVRQQAQCRVYAIAPEPLAQLDRWLEPYRQLWDGRLDALERHLDEAAADCGERERGEQRADYAKGTSR
jgi:DNA-binding transcriptional ArsR family regulator